MKGYVLATTEDQVRWYIYDPANPSPDHYHLSDTLDLRSIPVSPSKEHAREIAKRLQLGTWRYIKIG